MRRSKPDKRHDSPRRVESGVRKLSAHGYKHDRGSSTADHDGGDDSYLDDLDGLDDLNHSGRYDFRFGDERGES